MDDSGPKQEGKAERGPCAPLLPAAGGMVALKAAVGAEGSWQWTGNSGRGLEGASEARLIQS